MQTQSPHNQLRDHGGGLDGAIAVFGGTRLDWTDLSTGINPVPYQFGAFSADSWTALPDKSAQTELHNAARKFWNVPERFAILAAPGASSLIAALPGVFDGHQVDIPTPTYNEHAAAFSASGWNTLSDNSSDARVIVHPNNPDGHIWTVQDTQVAQLVVDESFADVDPDISLLPHLTRNDVVVLKSFGKFWGLAGMRLGFAIAAPQMIAKLRDRIGPWAVSGPALEIGTAALSDLPWAKTTRTRLEQDARRLDRIMAAAGHTPLGGTSLFRLYDTQSAEAFQARMAEAKIWSRVFPYSQTWVRLGLPAPDKWTRVEAAIQA